MQSTKASKQNFERETPSLLTPDPAPPDGTNAVVVAGTAAHGRQKEMELSIAEEVVS
ncbi:MAG: hypothetical protein QOJ86_3976, partial [Bradyrhizobium sp.]|nr:hypothetical protein [Bradyrhizobium sp.]